MSQRRQTAIAWTVVLGLVAAMVVRAFLALWMYGDRPRTWQYGAHPSIPAQTYATTRPTPRGPAPKQVTLPPAPKKEKAK